LWLQKIPSFKKEKKNNMKRINLLSIALLTLICGVTNKVFAQADTKTTELWLVDMVNKEGIISFGNPLRITDNEFYDNQPFFSKDGRFIFYASMPDTIQSDIYEYDVIKKTTRKITSTEESEFQPQPIPFDKNLLSIVRVEMDKSQRFYSVNLDGTEFSYLSEAEDSVAYYTWMNDTTVGMYKLNGAGGTLEQYDMIPLQSIILENGGFGRCLQKAPQSADLTYVAKFKEDDWNIMRYNFETQEKTQVCKTLTGEEDFCWTPYETILMGSKGKLYMLDTKMKDVATWAEVADYTKTIGNFYRMACSPMGNKIVLVSYKGTKP
jgi:Tol biopolymer transport system component